MTRAIILLRVAAAMLLLLLCGDVVVAQTLPVWKCTPIFPECVCQTPKTLTCADVATMRAAIVAKMNSFPAQSTAQARFKGGVVRLMFHDAAEFNNQAGRFVDGSPRLRSDGCVDLQNGGNAGLSTTISALDAIWRGNFCKKMSRGDFWYLAAKVVIEESCPYCKRGDPAFRVTNFSLPFFIGRIDRRTCATPGSTPTGSMLPNAEGGAAEVKRTLMDNLGLDVQHTVALLGAHCLGGASASGFSGHWGIRPDLFTSHFFQSLLLWGFVKTPARNPATGQNTLQQWNIDQATSATPSQTVGVFMLNTDMSLLYDVDHKRELTLTTAARNALPKECGPPTPISNANKCPLTKGSQRLDFEFWVRQFGDHSGRLPDQPGADKWLPAFSRAFAFIAQQGYASTDLTCMACTSPRCTAAACTTRAVQCGTSNVFVRH